jgi:hypothetical protein
VDLRSGTIPVPFASQGGILQVQRLTAVYFLVIPSKVIEHLEQEAEDMYSSSLCRRPERRAVECCSPPLLSGKIAAAECVVLLLRKDERVSVP